MPNLRRLAKDADSKTGGCPALYVDDDSPAVMVAQGPRASEEACAQLIELLPGESAVTLPAETVVRAARAYLAGHPEMGSL